VEIEVGNAIPGGIHGPPRRIVPMKVRLHLQMIEERRLLNQGREIERRDRAGRAGTHTAGLLLVLLVDPVTPMARWRRRLLDAVQLLLFGFDRLEMLERLLVALLLVRILRLSDALVQELLRLFQAFHGYHGVTK